MMNNYMVFVFNVYYPSGGMKDFVCSFAGKYEAMNFLKQSLIDDFYKTERDCCLRGHVYSIKDKKIICNSVGVESNDD